MVRSTINKSGVAINVAEGTDTFDDIFDVVSQHIDSWVDRPVLWDLSLLDFHAVDSVTLRTLVKKGKLLPQKRAGLKEAIVVESDLGFGMMRMFEAFSDDELSFEIHIFRKCGAAHAWLLEGNNMK